MLLFKKKCFILFLIATSQNYSDLASDLHNPLRPLLDKSENVSKDKSENILPLDKSENVFQDKTEDQTEPTTTTSATPSNVRIKREAGKYEDTANYRLYPRCGNLEMLNHYKCICGNETLIRIDSSDSMCCIPPDSNCSYTTEDTDDERRSDVECKDGVVQPKLLPCHGKCFNDYDRSQKLWKDSYFHCPELNYCVPIQDMCSGLCPSEQDTCDSRLRCYRSGYSHADRFDKLATLITEYVDGHKYCSRSQARNNQQHNQISRLDEDNILPGDELRLDLESFLQPCTTGRGEDGFECDNAYDNGRCSATELWCSGAGNKCDIGNTSIIMDHQEICRNDTLLHEVSCDSYFEFDVFNYGLRCTGNSKACYYPYYRKYDGNPKGARLTCSDKSHMKFPTPNVTCSTFYEQFMKQHHQQWCECDDTSNQWCVKAKNRSICKDPESWFKNQNTNKLVYDPHECETSCQQPGPDCLGMPSDYKSIHSTIFFYF